MENQRSSDVALDKLPIFDGDPDKAEEWLENFEKLSVECSLDPPDKLKMASSCFTDSAQEWFSLRDETFQTWTECKDEFLVRFLCSGALQVDTMVRLRRLEQDSTTHFSAHMMEVLRLCDVADPEMSDKDRILWFLKSVRADYRPALMLAGIESIDVLRRKCDLIDSIESLHEEEPVESAAPEYAPSQLTFKTKVPQDIRPTNLPAESTRIRNAPRGRPFCTFCRNHGHWFSTCNRRR